MKRQDIVAAMEAAWGWDDLFAAAREIFDVDSDSERARLWEHYRRIVQRRHYFAGLGSYGIDELHDVHAESKATRRIRRVARFR